MAINSVIQRFAAMIRPASNIPEQYRSNFKYLYLDILWMGVLFGSTAAFLSIYAARLGASADQIGFLSAAPALINLIFAIPSGAWMRGRKLSGVVFWSSVLNRVFYLPLVFFPLFLSHKAEVWVIIIMTLVMNIPLTVLNVSFNAFFMEIVPPDWRAQVLGVRNSLMAVLSLVFQLICGQILVHVTFPLGYQIVFGLGFIGAAMSSLQLLFLKRTNPQIDTTISETVESPAFSRSSRGFSFRKVLARLGLNPEVLSKKYGTILGLLFFFHIAQWLVIPVMPLYSVQYLKLDDAQISIAGAMFSFLTFVVSLQLSKITRRLGNRNATALGVLGLSMYPLISSVAKTFGVYLVANFMGGIAWGILGGALFNYIFENVSERNRSLYLAWYIMVSNASILIGSLAGPMIASTIGYPLALQIFGVMRLLAGFAILWLG